jgi:phosphoribosylglycinamide formyltransferase-1
VLKLAVLVSGRGSNLQAMIDAIERGQLPARIALVISDRRDAMALERARAHGVPTAVVPRKGFPDRLTHDQHIMALIAKSGAELVCLAGYMRLLSPEFVAAYRGRLVNIHPALLPSFPGLDVQRRALEYGVKVSGCTVHFVDQDMDTGPIIVQHAVAVLETDTTEDLAARVLEQEHLAYVEAIKLFAEGRLLIEGRRVRVLPAPQGKRA